MNPEHFRLECQGGQWVLRFLPKSSFAEARLFMRGPLLNGTGGRADLIQERLAPLGVGECPLIAPSQIHGDQVIVAAPELALPAHPDADGIVLAAPGLEASLRVADCAPVLVLPSEEAGRKNPWALLLHSGYKGTVLNIVRAGLAKVERLMGREAVTGASAWIGPCISGGNYPRTLEEWTRRGLETFHSENVWAIDEHFHFDIEGELGRQLVDCGLDASRVFLSRLDTAAGPGTCYSYRRGDRTDRMFLHVRLTSFEVDIARAPSCPGE